MSQELYKKLKSEGSVNFIGGGLAGAVSRTVVSPFERIKIILQVQKKTAIDQKFNAGIYASLKHIFDTEGWKGMFRGNGINCIRIFPYSAIQFIVYQNSMVHLFNNGISTSVNANRELARDYQRLICGSLCGFASVFLTYPIDLIRTRLSIQTSNLSVMGPTSTAINVHNPPGFAELSKRIWQTEGKVWGLYRGVVPTCLGVVPYVALNFTIYEKLKDFTILSRGDPSDASSSNLLKVSIGAVSGGVAQTIVYPFDLLRRRFQVINMGQHQMGFRYTGIANALYTIGKHEGGFKAYYNGLTINLFKVVPSTAVSWLVYELVCDFMREI
ncbi:hypothetical protein TPHA_0H00520 [Tetrapisispora phaffii CBS 4417]|uniref:Mitochondrial thiamine pyrophosphate carrier 1 n=1 Tax=Tetrapisispora phaffii (strain ATCC 24235 / CBS 4417 / NBRC 1672 / NRRL Y-8282 / UCD 70-5) TaxID=1071381 RepID=G8BWV8_TETPH|nr:hypothetical protein TPHA_0H00520 [Tetrapisispora phaffii CBS 4417]CCE64262.1 hypothetical protein TPHA_0H00520 [Tetrapisispora phaffii CBS 4417]